MSPKTLKNDDVWTFASKKPFLHIFTWTVGSGFLSRSSVVETRPGQICFFFLNLKANAPWSYLLRKFLIGKFKLLFSFTSSSFVSDKKTVRWSYGKKLEVICYMKGCSNKNAILNFFWKHVLMLCKPNFILLWQTSSHYFGIKFANIWKNI